MRRGRGRTTWLTQSRGEGLLDKVHAHVHVPKYPQFKELAGEAQGGGQGAGAGGTEGEGG